MQNSEENYIDLNKLPDNIRNELLDFYEFLIHKYGNIDKNIHYQKKQPINLLPRPIQKFDPLKREEIYAR